MNSLLLLLLYLRINISNCMLGRRECDTPPPTLVARLLLPLSRSRRSEYLRRGRYSVSAVVGREKHGGSRLHSGVLSPGRCHARWCSHAFPKGMTRSACARRAGGTSARPTTSVFGVLGSPNTQVFRLFPLGTYPQGWRLFLNCFADLAILPKAGAQFMFVPS
jgi:hypothetical protein